MDEEKIRTVAARLSQTDFDKLNKLIEVTEKETNIRITKTDMLGKLIRDEYERRFKKK